MAVKYAAHYAEMEQELRDLLIRTGCRLSTRDLAAATGYLHAGEYGLALEAIAEGMPKKDGHIDPPVYGEMIGRLAKRMEIEEDRPFLKTL
jgi:hypothetical protein